MAKKEEAAPEVPHKQYRVGPGKHYRFGRLYEPGEVVSIPENEKPAADWTPIEDDEEDEEPKPKKGKAPKAPEDPLGKAPAGAPTEPAKPSGRPSDREL